ncbi:TERF1-interacting nuclear factor 2 isoform X2 [Lepisosteus oculatus]|uniref:TERF1-interacting nuclear factor 2 isoform X2 n=1 Tax=Lepisosteus oculatus TaxID=7918 RepID=UPI00371FD271
MLCGLSDGQCGLCDGPEWTLCGLSDGQCGGCDGPEWTPCGLADGQCGLCDGPEWTPCGLADGQCGGCDGPEWTPCGLADGQCGLCDGPEWTPCGLADGQCGLCDGPEWTPCGLADGQCGVCDGPEWTPCGLADGQCGGCDGPEWTLCGLSDGPSPPVDALWLLAPPLRLVCATVWDVVRRRDLVHYGKVLEFLETVRNAVPEILTYRHMAKLTLGLRAKMILGMLVKQFSPDVISAELEKVVPPNILRPSRTVKMKDDRKVRESAENFQKLIRYLLEDPELLNVFMKESLPVQYGDQFDLALEKLVWEFVIRLDELLPIPDLSQTVKLLSAAASGLEDPLHLPEPELLQNLLQHHRPLEHLDQGVSVLSVSCGDCILSSLSSAVQLQDTVNLAVRDPALRMTLSPSSEWTGVRQRGARRERLRRGTSRVTGGRTDGGREEEEEGGGRGTMKGQSIPAGARREEEEDGGGRGKIKGGSGLAGARTEEEEKGRGRGTMKGQSIPSGARREKEEEGGGRETMKGQSIPAGARREEEEEGGGRGTMKGQSIPAGARSEEEEDGGGRGKIKGGSGLAGARTEEEEKGRGRGTMKGQSVPAGARREEEEEGGGRGTMKGQSVPAGARREEEEEGGGRGTMKGQSVPAGARREEEEEGGGRGTMKGGSIPAGARREEGEEGGGRGTMKGQSVPAGARREEEEEGGGRGTMKGQSVPAGARREEEEEGGGRGTMKGQSVPAGARREEEEEGGGRGTMKGGSIPAGARREEGEEGGGRGTMTGGSIPAGERREEEEEQEEGQQGPVSGGGRSLPCCVFYRSRRGGADSSSRRGVPQREGVRAGEEPLDSTPRPPVTSCPRRRELRVLIRRLSFPDPPFCPVPATSLPLPVPPAGPTDSPICVAVTRKRKLSSERMTPDNRWPEALSSSGEKENRAGLSRTGTASPVISPVKRHADGSLLSPEANDEIILDSEDEDTRNFKGRLFLKKYYRTKYNTFIPTLREFLRPSRNRTRKR